MTITLQFPDEMKAALRAQAEALGMTIEDWLKQMASQQVHPQSVAHLQHTNPNEWVQHLRAWVETPRPLVPPLTDDAVRRDRIYPDRF